MFEKESFGFVFLEVMVCGVLCIGINIGGIFEVIEYEKIGYICEVGDVEDVVSKVI